MSGPQIYQNGVFRKIVRFSVALAFSAAPIFVSAQGNSISETTQMKNLELADISSMRWKSRVILVSEPETAKEVFEEFKANELDINDRDINWFVRDGETITTNFDSNVKLSESFRENVFSRYFNSDRSAVVLIGKDGGVKVRADQLDLGALFATIDVMPMRLQEIKRNDPD